MQIIKNLGALGTNNVIGYLEQSFEIKESVSPVPGLEGFVRVLVCGNVASHRQICMQWGLCQSEAGISKVQRLSQNVKGYQHENEKPKEPPDLLTDSHPRHSHIKNFSKAELRAPFCRTKILSKPRVILLKDPTGVTTTLYNKTASAQKLIHESVSPPKSGGSPYPHPRSAQRRFALTGTHNHEQHKEGRRNLSNSALDKCWGLLGFLWCLGAWKTQPQFFSFGGERTVEINFGKRRGF